MLVILHVSNPQSILHSSLLHPGPGEPNTSECVTQPPLPPNSQLGLAVQGCGGCLPCSFLQWPLTQITGASLDYSSHGVAPPAWLPWALTTLFFSFSASGLERVITEITYADDVKCPKLKRVYPEKDREK